MNPRRAGFTLIEILVGGVIGLLVMTAVFNVFVQGARMFVRGQARTDLQAAGMVTLNAVSRELRGSAFPTLTIVAGPALSFQVLENNTSDVGLFVVYFFDAPDHQLVRKTVPIPGTTNRLTPKALEAACLDRNGTERAVTHGVLAMTVEPAQYPSLSARDPRVTVTLTQEQAVLSDSLQETIETSVFLRNHL